MSYNTELQANNTTLQTILDTINNLPEAESGGIDTSDATATAADILSGKTAYANGEMITGTIASQAATTITPKASSQTAIAAGTYAAGAVTVAGDKNFTSSNIKSGVSIFGLAGTYTGDSSSSGVSGNIAEVSGNTIDVVYYDTSGTNTEVLDTSAASISLNLGGLISITSEGTLSSFMASKVAIVYQSTNQIIYAVTGSSFNIHVSST